MPATCGSCMNNVNSLAHVCLPHCVRVHVYACVCMCVCVLSACCKPGLARFEGRDCDGATAALPLAMPHATCPQQEPFDELADVMASDLPPATCHLLNSPDQACHLLSYKLFHIYLLLAATNFRQSSRRQQRFICCLPVCRSSFL